MSEKRRDKKGRVLRNGEIQRADNSYQYRYTDPHGRRKYVYAPTLEELRAKENTIIRDLNDGIDYAGGEISVTELVVRCLPMSPTVYETLLKVVNNRIPPKVEMLIDGCSDFLFLDKNGYPKVAMHLQNSMRNMNRKFKKMFGNSLPDITPHVLRHTFCTNMQQAGLDVKSLQYMMGHSTASVTLDVYTHTDYDAVERAFRKVL